MFLQRFVICVLSHTGARTRASWSHRTGRTEGLAGTVGSRCHRIRRFALFLRLDGLQVSQQVFSLGFSGYAVSLQSRLAMASFTTPKKRPVDFDPPSPENDKADALTKRQRLCLLNLGPGRSGNLDGKTYSVSDH